MGNELGKKSRENLRFVIIGAGMAGILSAIKLREAGFSDVIIYEKAERLGGTWDVNQYPGLTCDVPSHLYSYSFALNPDWSQQFAAGPEIREYFEKVARDYDVESLIQYSTEITHAEFKDGRWHVTTANGGTDVGDIVIAATGVLHHPAYPSIEGLDSFEGECFHSARWNHDVPLEGKRVGVVGTGSTATQIVGAIVDDVAELSLFQRTAQWVIPVQNEFYDADRREEFRRCPEEILKIREEVSRAFIDGFANVLGDADSPMLEAMQAACQANLDENVKDPELRAKLTPNYRAGCKRLVMSENFYQAIQRPNANLVVEGIEKIEPKGVRTRDGKLHELDVLVLATGFKVDAFMRPMTIAGRDGISLDDLWSDGPSAYMAISIPHFPNLFMLNGPNAPVGNFSLIDVAELQFAYIMQLIDKIVSGECKEISVSSEAAKRFDSERQEASKTTIWATGCKSWYLDASGLPTAWPWSFDRFCEKMQGPEFADYETR